MPEYRRVVSFPTFHLFTISLPRLYFVDIVIANFVDHNTSEVSEESGDTADTGDLSEGGDHDETAQESHGKQTANLVRPYY